VPEGRLRPDEALPARVQGEGSVCPGRRPAAFRDVQSFFRYEAKDDFGTANPVFGHVRKAIIRGVSQSGNFTRHYLFLGMNEDEAGHIVHDGAWPLIAGRRVANNSRWGQPDGVLELYQMGSEGPQWWKKWPDRVRDLPTRGILDRCQASRTCPRIVETFGGAEVFALKMTMSWVGTSADKDIRYPTTFDATTCRAPRTAAATARRPRIRPRPAR